MSWRMIWFERDTGRLRCWWRVLGFFFAVALGLSLLLTIFLALPSLINKVQGINQKSVIEVMYFAMVSVPIAFIIAGIWALKTFDHLPAYTLGLSFRGPWFLALLYSFLFGLLTILTILGILGACGYASFQVHGMSQQDLAVVLSFAGHILILNFAVEVVIHGYCFQTLLRSVKPVIALFFSSTLALVLVIVLSPRMPLLQVVNNFVLFTLLGMGYLRFGSLWPLIGFSSGWAFVQCLLHLQNTGSAATLPSPFTAVLHGPLLLTGGAFGIEQSVLSSVMLLISLAVLAYLRVGLPLESFWWEWRQLSVSLREPPTWDFSIGDRYYQWKLLVKDAVE